MNHRITRTCFPFMAVLSLAFLFYFGGVFEGMGGDTGILMAKSKTTALKKKIDPAAMEKMEELQAEAKTNLAAIATAQISFYGEHNKWGKTFKEIGFSPEGEQTYSLYLSCKEVIPAGKTGYKGCPLALKKWLERPCENKDGCFRAGAVGNIDADQTLDIWGIDEKKTPTNLLNDTEK